jgi:AcrR family transcriptional regulator
VTSLAETRTALLDAGVRLYGSNAAELLKGLSAGAVADEAGFHRQTFYRYWETQREYVQDLLRHVLGPDRPPVADGINVLPERRHLPQDPEAFVRDLSQHDFARAMTDPVGGMRIGLVMMNALAEGQPRELLQDLYDSTMGTITAGYDDLLDGWGREMVPGHTTRDLARMIQAAVLGLVVLAKGASDDPPGDVLLATAIRTFVDALTRPVASEASATG